MTLDEISSRKPSRNLGRRVKIVGGPADVLGKTGRIGEVGRAYPGLSKIYTIDVDGGGSIQLSPQHIRLIKDITAIAEDSAAYVQSQTGMTPAQYQKLKQRLGDIESGGRYNVKGGARGAYTGKYQLGSAALADAAKELGIKPPTRQELLANPALQDQLQDALMARNVKYIAQNPRDVKSAQRFQAMTPQERAALLAMAHSAGHGGAKAWMNRGQESKDAFGTTGEVYRQAAAAAFDDSDTGAVTSGTGMPVTSGTGMPVTAPVSRQDTPRASGGGSGGYAGTAGSRELQRINPSIRDVNKIYAGDVIQTPGGGSYKIQRGDTLDRIARAQGVSGVRPPKG
jgi:LysM repeat protein